MMGRGRGLPEEPGDAPTPVAEPWLRQFWALGPAESSQGKGGALGEQADAGVGSASEFGLGDSFRQDISTSHRLASRGSRVGQRKSGAGWR